MSQVYSYIENNWGDESAKRIESMKKVELSKTDDSPFPDDSSGATETALAFGASITLSAALLF